MPRPRTKYVVVPHDTFWTVRVIIYCDPFSDAYVTQDVAVVDEIDNPNPLVSMLVPTWGLEGLKGIYDAVKETKKKTPKPSGIIDIAG